MSNFGTPKDCINGCDGLIYFDAHSSVGHPTPDKWIPLVYKEGRKTDTIHICPDKKQNGSSLLTKVSPATKPDLDNLAVIKTIAALNEYVAIKEKS